VKKVGAKRQKYFRKCYFFSILKLLHLPTYQAGPSVRGRREFFRWGRFSIILDSIDESSVTG
jgi:hypothetical protein